MPPSLAELIAHDHQVIAGLVGGAAPGPRFSPG